MDLHRRIRALFYFAALLLCLSACFVYAQDSPGQDAAPSNAAPAISPAAVLPLWIGPTHARFLAPAPEARLILDPHAKAATAPPVVTRALLSEVEAVSRPHHHLLHIGRSRTHQPRGRALSDSAILDMITNSGALAPQQAEAR